MTLGKTIIIFRSIAGLFLALTVFPLLVLPAESMMIQSLRIISMFIFAIAAFTPASKYQNRIRYIYTGIYILGILAALPLIYDAYTREYPGPDYALIIFRLLQMEIFIVFMVITLNPATSKVKSDAYIIE